jgi:hypothetical protein
VDNSGFELFRRIAEFIGAIVIIVVTIFGILALGDWLIATLF